MAEPRWEPPTAHQIRRGNCRQGQHESMLVLGTHRCRWCHVLLDAVVLPTRDKRQPSDVRPREDQQHHEQDGGRTDLE